MATVNVDLLATMKDYTNWRYGNNVGAGLAFAGSAAPTLYNIKALDPDNPIQDITEDQLTIIQPYQQVLENESFTEQTQIITYTRSSNLTETTQTTEGIVTANGSNISHNATIGLTWNVLFNAGYTLNYQTTSYSEINFNSSKATTKTLTDTWTVENPVTVPPRTVIVANTAIYGGNLYVDIPITASYKVIESDYGDSCSCNNNTDFEPCRSDTLTIHAGHGATRYLKSSKFVSPGCIHYVENGKEVTYQFVSVYDMYKGTFPRKPTNLVYVSGNGSANSTTVMDFVGNARLTGSNALFVKTKFQSYSLDSKDGEQYAWEQIFDQNGVLLYSSPQRLVVNRSTECINVDNILRTRSQNCNTNM
ncbi:ETX/MTX2 family pore-forming toxin [Bacillus thuringiensis]|nr:ETX/MTX2 family pore-forming toxin [Bacillus thuringiensis]